MPLPLIPLAGASLLTKVLGYTFLAGLITRVLAALGFGVFAFVGIDAGIDQLQSTMNGYMGGMPLSVKQLIDMAGLTTIIFWIIQAHAFRVLLSAGRSFLGRNSKLGN